jgi:excisionase family DNA binding protein
MSSTEREAFTVQEIADRLGIGRRTVVQLIKSKELPSIKLGGRRLIPAAPLRALLAGSDRPEPPKAA